MRRYCYCYCSYVADDRELRRWCASMHLLSAQPHCIAVDDLSALVDARCVSRAFERPARCAAVTLRAVLSCALRRSFPDRRARESALAKALALLHEAAAHASARLAAAAGAAADAAALRGSADDAAAAPLTPRRPPPRCQLIVSDRGGADGEGPPLLFVYQRWLPLIVAIRTRGDGGGGGAAGGSCALQLLPTDDGPQDPSGAIHAAAARFAARDSRAVQ